MATSKPRAINISLGVDGYERYSESLGTLAAELKLSGVSELIRYLAEIAIAAMPETVAALNIAHQCSIGGDWDELIDFIRPGRDE